MSSLELYFDHRLAFHKTICRKLSTTMISKWRWSHRRLKGNDWWMDDPFHILIVHTDTLYTPNVPEIDQRNKSFFDVLNIYYSLLDIKHSYRSGGDTETWNLFVPSSRVGPWFIVYNSKEPERDLKVSRGSKNDGIHCAIKIETINRVRCSRWLPSWV